MWLVGVGEYGEQGPLGSCMKPAIGNTAGMVESIGQSSIGDAGRLAGVVCGVVMADVQ